MRDRISWEKYLGFFTCLEITREVSWHYGEIFRHLKESGKMIGQNDLWIAATALAHDRAIVTRNTSEFTRVPGLEVREF